MSPGRNLPQQQGTIDRDPIYACNLREKTRIATWNVRTLNQPGKLECILAEASRLTVDILGMAELTWTNSGKCITDDHVLDTRQNMHGEGILLTQKVAKSMMGFHVTSDRVLVVRLASKLFNIVINQVYTPTSACSEDRNVLQ